MDRVISLVMIVAVIGCPIRCGYGLGPGGGCCAAGCENALATLQAVEQTSCIEMNSRCCCDRSDALKPIDAVRTDSKSRDPEPLPHRCPNETSCQGICGGAVIEKPLALDVHRTFSLLSIMEGESAVDTSIDGSITPASGPPGFATGKNLGRFVRLLHQSFLC